MIQGEKMKHLLFLLFLVNLSMPSFTMKRETGEPEGQPSKKLKITAQEEKSAFEALPKEIKVAILGFLVTAPGSTKTAKLYAAADNIRNFMLLNKECLALVQDPLITSYLIHELAQRYAGGNSIEAVLALRTVAAGQWLQRNSSQKILDMLGARLILASVNNKLEELSFILNYFPNLINYSDHARHTALMHAAERGNLAILNRLLQVPAININIQDVKGITALYFAVQENHLPIVDRLLSAPNVNVNLASHTQVTPLLIAAEKGYTVIVEKLLKMPNININAFNQVGGSALGYAAQNGYLTIVEQLLAKPNLEINHQNNKGATALILSIINEHIAITQRLLQLPNIDINLSTSTGNTALMIAAYKGYLPIVQQLLQMPGLQINARSRNGNTALGEVMRSNKPNKEAIIKLLKEHGAVE
jgi:ankyrin repeat protein